MELKLKKMQAASCRCISEIASEQGIDLELNLPDYCSDIKRILKCVVEPCINSVSIVGERATASGEIIIRLIYVNDNEKTDCFEKKTELSESADIKGMSDSTVVLANASVEYVNCRAASQRRVTVNGTVSVRFTAIEKAKSDYLCGIEGNGSQTKTEKLEYNDLVSVAEKCFDMSETIALASEKKNVGKIIRTDAGAVVQSLKAVSGKLLIKGELAVDILYCADSDSSEIQKLRHTMPISQIADIPDIDENSICDVSLCVRSLSVEPRADSSGGNRLLEIAAKLCAFTKAYGKVETEIITDCYSTKGTIEVVGSEVDFCTAIRRIEKNQSIKKTAELSGQPAKEIIDVRAIKTTSSFSVSDGKSSVGCSTIFSVIFVDEDGKIQYCERSIDYTFDDVCEYSDSKPVCEPEIYLKGIKAGILSRDKIEISFDAKLDVYVYLIGCKKICTDAAFNEEEEKENCALTICFSTKGEKIWNIAKKYRTTVKAIAEENALNGEILEEDKMLMVPII